MLTVQVFSLFAWRGGFAFGLVCAAPGAEHWTTL